MQHHDSIQEAVNDLATIRRAIERTGQRGSDSIPVNRFAIDANLIFQGLCLVVTLALIAFELVSNRSMSTIMMLSAQDRELGILGLAQVGIALPAFTMCIYFVVWRASRHSDQSFSDYLVRNFQYLRNLSFVSDLLVKFIPLSLLVLGSHPEWIPPVLTLYVGDYLIQGRFFNLPVKAALSCGVLCLVAAAIQYLAHSNELLWPLAIFAATTAFSVSFLVWARSQRVTTSGQRA